MSLIRRLMAKISQSSAPAEPTGVAGPTSDNHRPAPDAGALASQTQTGAAALLTHLCQTRQLLEVKLEGETLSYQSMIVAVDAARGLLWLDELTPGAPRLNDAHWLIISHQRQGEVLTLRLPLVAGPSQGRSAIATVLPEHADYRPRRAWSRFGLPGAQMKAKVRAVGNEPQFGKILNLSAGGMRLALTGNQLGYMRRDALLPLCQFQLSGGLRINCQARVKSARIARTPFRHTQVSLEFTDILPSDRAALDRQLHRLEQLNQASDADSAQAA